MLDDEATTDPQGWERDGSCVYDKDPGAWFAGKTEHARRQHAVQVCLECPVQSLCLELALRRGIDNGVWGATTPNERKRLRKLAHA